MQEALIVFIVVLVLCGAPLAWVAPPEVWLVAGVWLTSAGLLFGVPTGFYYHVALYRALELTGELPERWWLRPTALHDRIPKHARSWVLGWCYAGAVGFLVCVLGCLVTAVGAFRTIATL